MALEKSKSIEAGLQTILTEEDPPDSKPKNISLCKKIKLIFTNITVEPVLICYVLPSVMASIATQNLSLEKACRVNLQMDEDICDALSIRNRSGYNESDEIVTQTLITSMNTWKSMIQSLVPSLLLLFLGSWSDRHQRRKPCIILPILGEICTCTGFLLSTYFFYQLPMEFNAFFEAVPPALTGGWFAMFMAVFSYVSRISSVETRTLRIGAVNLFSNVSVTVGIALSGILYNEIGFYGVFSLAIAMYTTALIYAIVYVKDMPKNEEVIVDKNVKKVNPVLDFFNLKHIKETLNVAFKDGPRNRKRRICTIMILVMVIIGPMHGEMQVMYLFVRHRFKWNEIDYSLYSTFQFVIHVCGTVFSLMFFSKFLKVDDAVLGMISSTSKIAASLVYAFAPTSTIFYLGAIIEALNGTSFIAMRSIISKLVPPEELGKINSLFGVSEALMPLVYGPMYNIVYETTIKVLPGSFFLLGGALTAPAIVIFYWLYREHQKDQQEEAKEKPQKASLLPK
ncbi:lysosomal proton-coupled steroid conjugate and bile acid symporter SLC46A3 [Tribolium castaneum]|uniref:Solute carrier family 46 member 3-like Protein n=1 Tax=Tribolium castaneum TaxID=7070 RepID=D6WRR1_TRICA|nr:PREDICTED: solute carrier family 46 member 3 [Tribolium castaneum]EFA05964.2 Solute carrier family 46 member 3-like Protein [Tribolium castaneum]|eukprot:XP_975637.3 PREDICTED: solute carrier family 46 member 3 [Tribolium castaneum]